jgi:hypothetical protein
MTPCCGAGKRNARCSAWHCFAVRQCCNLDRQADGVLCVGVWTKHLHTCTDSCQVVVEGWDRQDRYYPRMEETRKACRILTGKPEEKRLLGRSKSRMQDNTKMGLQSILDVILLLKVVIKTSIYFLGSKTFKCLQHPVNLIKHHILLLCVHKLYTGLKFHCQTLCLVIR